MAGWKKVAFYDEVATLTDTVTPSDVSTSASIGTSTEAARADHTHKIGAGAINASNLFAAGVVDNAAIGDSQVTTSKINIDGNLNFNQKEALNLAFHTTTLPDGTPVTGQVYFDTDDNHIYVYVP